MSRRRKAPLRALLPALLVALQMGGCAPLVAPPPAPAPTPEEEAAAARQAVIGKEAEEVMALLAYYQQVQGMSAEDLRREFHNASAAVGTDKTEFSRLRLALLYCVPAAPWRDDAKLLALLDAAPARNASPESPRRQLVTLLQKLVVERAREEHRADEAQRHADELQRRADELQQKLDAMLEIERSLRSRKRTP